MRWLEWRGPGRGIHEASYLAGPRVAVLKYKRFSTNAKVLAGVGHFVYPNSTDQGNYFAFAPGISLDYRASRRVSVRADYEYQMWPNFKGTGGGSGGLTPNGFTFGISYGLF
jgi:opacity protein-like surface antigen